MAFTAAVWPLAPVVLPPRMYCLPSPQVLLALVYILPALLVPLALVIAIAPKVPPAPRSGSSIW